MNTRRSRGLTVLMLMLVLLAVVHSYHGIGMPPQEQAGGTPTPIETPALVEAPEPDRSRPLGKLEAGEWVSTEFGPSGEGYVRISFATDEQSLAEGLRRFGDVVEKL